MNFKSAAQGAFSAGITEEPVASSSRKRVLISSSDVTVINVDNAERAMDIERVRVSPRDLIREGKFGEAREALRAITNSAVMEYVTQGRDINALNHAIEAYMTLLRVNEHKRPFIDFSPKQEDQLCDDLKAAVQKVYERMSQDNSALAEHHLSQMYYKYGSESRHPHFTKKAIAAIDTAYLYAKPAKQGQTFEVEEFAL